MAKVVRVVRIGKESIVVLYGIQALCINNFGDNNRWKMKHLKEELAERQVMELSELLVLTSRHGVKLTSTRINQ